MPSELERQRLENIQRNQRLLKDFQLEELANAAFGDLEKPNTPKKRAAPRTQRERVKKEPTAPLRKSRRLQGEKPEVLDPVALEVQTEQHKKQIDTARKEGEQKLESVVKNGEWEHALEILNSFGGEKVSMGDFFDSIPASDDDVVRLRKEFASLEPDNRDIKLTPERAYSMCFHPSTTQKMLLVGDKYGDLAIWDASKPDDEGVVNLKAHTRAIAGIHVDPQNMNRVYTCSYDGSVRLLDLPEGKSTEVLVTSSDPSDPIGVSDFHLVDPNTIYYTTLNGEFGIVDTRTNKPTMDALQLHENKIGGFAVNPKANHQIATASLDRTLKVWDLRSPGAQCALEYHSRLSVSCADWNSSGQLACNGYDDTINIFDLEEATNWTPKGVPEQDEISPEVRLKHNCQTGRWVSILKCKWQRNPRDGIQKLCIGNMKRFIDIFSASGHQLAHLDSEMVTAVPAVVQMHPTMNWVAGATASGKVYLFT